MGLFEAFSGKGRKPAPPAVEALVRQALAKLVTDVHRLGPLMVDEGRVRVEIETTEKDKKQQSALRSQCVSALAEIPGVSGIEVKILDRSGPAPLQRPALQTRDALAGVKNIIAVASGKGGVGKSTVAVNLAYALHAQGLRVGLVDADVYGPSVPTMTGRAVPQGMEGERVIPPMASGVKTISVAMFASADQAAILRGPMASQIIRQFLTQVEWGELDYLVIDYPPGTGDIQLTLSQVARITGAVLVTTPQDVALIDVRRAMTMFEKVGIPVLGIVETMSYFVCDGCDKRHYIFRSAGGQKVAREQGLPLLGQIPIDPAIAENSDAGTPVALHPSRSDLRATFSDLATAVLGEVEAMRQPHAGVDSFHIDWRPQP